LPTYAIDGIRHEAHKAAFDLLSWLQGYSREKGHIRPEEKLSIATAESVTGGLIFSTLIDIPFYGSHKYGCFGVYETNAKRVFLGVRTEDVYTHKCANEMACGILKNSNATIAISVTGNSMPWDSDEHKAGEVFIGIAGYVLDDDGKTCKIMVSTRGYNMCRNIEMCRTWFQTPGLKKEANLLAERLREPPLYVNTYNNSEQTSLMSLYIRNAITKQALIDCKAFAENNLLIVPDFVRDNINFTNKVDTRSSFNREGSNNKLLTRPNLQIICKNLECDDESRLYKQEYQDMTSVASANRFRSSQLRPAPEKKA
jgi:PncC family amidohydrolase